jgi:hypothetical protein
VAKGNVRKQVAAWGLPLAIVTAGLAFFADNSLLVGFLTNISVSVLVVVCTVNFVDRAYEKRLLEAQAPSQSFAIRKLQILLHRAIGSCYLQLARNGADTLVTLISDDVTRATTEKELDVRSFRDRMAAELTHLVGSHGFIATRTDAEFVGKHLAHAMSEIDELLDLRRWALAVDIAVR